MKNGPRLLSLLVALCALVPEEGRTQYRTAREVPSEAGEMPNWSVAPAFKKDVFTFVRIKYHQNSQARRGWRGSGRSISS